jgi:hypothetical protein
MLFDFVVASIHVFWKSAHHIVAMEEDEVILEALL